MDSPRTEAGRELLAALGTVRIGGHSLRSDIIAIEQQARDEGRQEAVRLARAHTPRLYENDPHGSQIHCSCGVAFHMAAWFAHMEESQR